MSFPFYGKEFSFTQPDGSKIDVKGWGDQHHAVFETLDGYTLAKDPVTGFYQFADIMHEELKPTGLIPNANHANLVGVGKNLRNGPTVVKSKVFSSEGLPPGKTRWRERRENAKRALMKTIVDHGPMFAPPQRQTVGTFVGLCLLIEFPDVPATIRQQEVDDFC